METVSMELIGRIRTHINRNPKQRELLKNLQKWCKLTAALTVLEDATNAIEYYLDFEYPQNVGGKYLFTHGLLQTLFLQEDAADHISQSLFDREIDWKKEYPDAFAVRKLRNDVTGHPSCRDNHYFIYLAQISLCQDGFYYVKEDSKTGKSETIDVNTRSAINDTARCINSILMKEVEILDREFKEHIEKHKDRKMYDIFHSLVYAIEKIKTDPLESAWGYNETKKMVSEFEEEVKKRYGSTEDYKYILDEIYELYELIDHGEEKVSPEIWGNTRKYLLQCLFSKLEELQGYSKEIDEYFENYGEPPIGLNGDEPPKIIFDIGTCEKKETEKTGER